MLLMSRKKHLYNVCLTNQSILIPYHVISTVILYTKFCKEKKIYTRTIHIIPFMTEMNEK